MVKPLAFTKICLISFPFLDTNLFNMVTNCIGVADIMGRNFGSTKIPYNPSKSWAGSISMFVFGFLVSIGWVSSITIYLIPAWRNWHGTDMEICLYLYRMLYYYSALGYLELDWALTVQRVALVSLVATLVESLPITNVIDDNISVPLASMVTAFLSFGY